MDEESEIESKMKLKKRLWKQTIEMEWNEI